MTKISLPFTVNSLTEGYQQAADIAVLANGQIMIVWESRKNNGDATGTEFRGQLFDANGSRAGEEMLLLSSPRNQDFSPAVAAFGDIGFVLSWTLSPATSNFYGTLLRSQAFSADGALLGGSFAINSTTGNRPLFPKTAGLADGGTAAVWTSYEPDRTFDIRARSFDKDGIARSADFIVNATNSISDSNPEITGLADGRFLVTWDYATGRFNGPSEDRDVLGRIISADGSVLNDEIAINSTTDFVQSGAHIHALANGGFVATWESQENFNVSIGPRGTVSTSDEEGVRARLFDANGVALGSDFLVNAGVTDEVYSPTVTELADGRLVFAWATSAGTGASETSAVHVRLFAADGTVLGGEFDVAQPADQALFDVFVTELAGESVMVTWRTQVATGDTDIKASIIDFSEPPVLPPAPPAPVPEVFDGTAAADLWTGSVMNDRAYGAGGNDTLNGDEGADRLYGGWGNDLIRGGMGDDVLVGGRGRDVLVGGYGSDRFWFSSKAEAGDIIRDFSKVDLLVFQNASFKGVSEGVLDEKYFVSSASKQALDGNDHFIFRTTDDTLWYDADGTGRSKAILVADFSGNVSLSFDDIFIV